MIVAAALLADTRKRTNALVDDLRAHDNVVMLLEGLITALKSGDPLP